MLHIFKNWLKKLRCTHEYNYLCSGENAYTIFRFYKCKHCGKTKIENIGEWIIMNKYLVKYNVGSIPNNDDLVLGQMFEFTHASEEVDLEEVEDEVISYLLDYFTPNNFNIEEIILVEGDE